MKNVQVDEVGRIYRVRHTKSNVFGKVIGIGVGLMLLYGLIAGAGHSAQTHQPTPASYTR